MVDRLLKAPRGRHGDDHPAFADVAQLLEDIATVHRREVVRRSDDNSRRKVQNIRGDSSATTAQRRSDGSTSPVVLRAGHAN